MHVAHRCALLFARKTKTRSFDGRWRGEDHVYTFYEHVVGGAVASPFGDSCVICIGESPLTALVLLRLSLPAQNENNNQGEEDNDANHDKDKDKDEDDDSLSALLQHYRDGVPLTYIL
eukprot:TRINITY_DN2789_c1_g1_i2.p1 TRINITY_DN2789_c1_g1~~TRINITY_DN2789_c1_g1_i2.p1  ORF type:complete len:118 (-),score=10.94 TRINITY_DN2789_c1_g1_i2:224-577(-)